MVLHSPYSESGDGENDEEDDDDDCDCDVALDHFVLRGPDRVVEWLGGLGASLVMVVEG